MILFAILMSVLLAIAVASTVLVIIGAGSFIAVFGDVIVFCLIVWIIFKLFRRKKEK